MDKIIVTVSRDGYNLDLAQSIAKENGWEYISREDLMPEKLKNNLMLVVEKDKISLRKGKSSLFFHPGMSHLRIKNLVSGEKDRFIEATGLKPGERMLDCTLGMASDAIVASYYLGEKGKVVGLEAVREVAFVVKNGLLKYKTKDALINNAMARIEVKIVDYTEFLLELSSNEFDCIYFDPMFKKPNLASSGINMLRPFAFYKDLTEEHIGLALSKTTKHVVVKETSLDKLKELNPHEVFGGKNARVFYAHWNK